MRVAPDVRVNTAPPDFEPSPELRDVLGRLHDEFAPRRLALVAARRARLEAAHAGRLPDYLPPSEATTSDWRVELPDWCRDQRNQMTGPADDAELVVKMLNSGAPGVMLDLEDSIVNAWDHVELGVRNVVAALEGRLAYFDRKRNTEIGIRPSETAVFVRPRGLHIGQAGVVAGEVTAASIVDVAMVATAVDRGAMKHPLAFYVPKSESAEEALWWRDLFERVAELMGWPRDEIKCMALVESHPLAFETEEFLFNLRDHILGLNLGRWDYMASLIHFNLRDPRWVLPDRNTIPHDVAFFQNLRELLPEVCHKHGALAIGGMTALYPSREDAELNARALAVLEKDKRNEASCLMDGAWTGHPDQNAIAVAQFPEPNQLSARRPDLDLHPDLRPAPSGVGTRSEGGTRAAVRTVIRYRDGVLSGKGASLLDGYMEDLATDRIYRLMIAQRALHGMHEPEAIGRFFDEELARLAAERPADTERLAEARRLSEDMIARGQFDPV